MMKRSMIVGVCSLAGLLLLPSMTQAQSFLQRLQEQLERAASPSPPESRDTLPPPATEPPATERNAAESSGGHPTLGIRVAPVTEDDIRSRGLVVRKGALVSAIEQGSPAERAGLPLGAVIVALDGRRIDSPDDLIQEIRRSRPGQTIELTYYDRNRLGRKTVTLAGRDVPSLLVAPDQADARAPAASTPPRPLPPGPTYVPPAGYPAAPGAPSLEQQLGAGGQRPVLGRLGRVFDSLVAPAQAVEPYPPVVAQRPESEVAVLRDQVAELQRQVETLQRTVEALQKQVAEKNPPR